jgi:sec-independent protein translocase protein TatB
MFGIGPQELVIVALIALVVLGPRRLPQMARDLGSFVREARSSLDEFREELDSEEVDEAGRDVEELKNKPASSRDLGPPGSPSAGTLE